MRANPNRRILLVDDTPAIHQDFRKILCSDTESGTELQALESTLFGDTTPQRSEERVKLDSAYQGQEALSMVIAGLQGDDPYAMAFVDMRMPPGWDGVETIEQLWKADPRLQVVICTAYSDHSWDDVLARLDAQDRLLILKKPFDNIEVRQLASSMTAKWELARRSESRVSTLETAVEQRSTELEQANGVLQASMTERERLEGQLMQSDKLASIGQLAAGVAHEINNPIAYVFSNMGTLERYLTNLFDLLNALEQAVVASGSAEIAAVFEQLCAKFELSYLREDAPDLMKESKEGVARVRKIVQDLKDFSRVDSAQEFQLADLHQGILSTLNIVANEIKYKADVVKAFGDVPEVECLPSQINQVLMNLVINAADAIATQQRGLITIRTDADAENAWFEVADTGGGMSPETLARVFDPFFTTKPVGKGTGLGLSLSYGIVQKHHGRIDARSTLGEGTTFRVVLPLRQALNPTEPSLIEA